MAFNATKFQERAKFKHHEASHDFVCKHCGHESESYAAKIYHVRTHKAEHYRCELCHFVGSTKISLETHIKYKHTEAMCDLCGKVVSCGATLRIHKYEVHKLKRKKLDEVKKFFCHICGKPYCSKQVLKKHIVKHSREDSTVNKLMLEDVSEYKYMCTRHNNCKKYFKKAGYLKKYVNFDFVLKNYRKQNGPVNNSFSYVPKTLQYTVELYCKASFKRNKNK